VKKIASSVAAGRSGQSSKISPSTSHGSRSPMVTSKISGLRRGRLAVSGAINSAGSSAPTCVSAGINPCSQRSLDSRLTNSGSTV